ncbi:MAG TPA: hypothetical protein VGC67_03750 [Cellulomonas sp.]
MFRRISAIDLPLPPGWVAWRPRGGNDEADRIARTVGTTPAARVRSRQEVLDTERSLVTGVAYRHAAAWVPAGRRPEAVATVVVELLAGSQTDSEPSRLHLRRVRRQIRFNRQNTSSVLYRDAVRTEIGGIAAVLTRRTVPAGMSVTLPGPREHIPLGRRMREELLCTLFPAGAMDGIELRFGSADPDRLSSATAQAASLAASMTIQLAPAV